MNTNKTPSTPPSGTADGISKATPGTGDLPDARKAINFLEGHKFDPNDDNLNNDRGAPLEAQKENESAVKTTRTCMMFAAPTLKESPALQTELWPHKGEAPNPVTIGKAQKSLAAGVEKIDSDEAKAGIHMPEDKET